MALQKNSMHPQESIDLPDLDETALDLFVNDICGGDEEIIADLLETYCQSSKSLISEMNQTLKNGEKDELRRAAHSLKSSCRIFGAEWLAGNCEKVEQLAVEGRTESVATILEQIHVQTRHLRILLHKHFEFHDCMDNEA